MKRKIKESYFGLYVFGLVVGSFVSLQTIFDILSNKSNENLIRYIVAFCLCATGLYIAIKYINKEK